MRYHRRMASRPFALAPSRAVRCTRMALLALALLMALAQAVAIRHAYSHTPGEAATHSGAKHPGGLAHCETCIVAAAIGGAAPPGPALLPVAAALPAPDLTAAFAPRSAPPLRPYAIRAPPRIAS